MNRPCCHLITRVRLLAMSAVLWGIGTVAAAQTATPIPEVTGPIPVTTDSYPLMAANRIQAVVDLTAAGYVEEEFVVRGTANVYRWESDGSLSVKTPDAPYTTRILVRRPADPTAFSGNVVVELVIEARRYDWAFIWGQAYQHFFENGDAFVAITHDVNNLTSLKTFDPIRYASLSFANPDPGETCGPNNQTSDSEPGLAWDMISQVGTLLKSGLSSGPLPGFDVEHVYMTSHHGQAATYALTVHSRSFLADGGPVYDGYVIKSSDRPDPISRCDPALANEDPRLLIENVGVPVIRVVPEAEVLRGNVYRRPDSDAPDDPYRLYEIPGAPRMDKIYFEHLPSIEDQIKAGQPASNSKWPYDAPCTPDIDLVDYPAMRYAVNSAFRHLYSWVQTGTPPPRAERIAVNNPGTPDASINRDEFGNARGGVRNPYVDVPTATYIAESPGGCRNILSTQEFDWQRLLAIYGSPANYAGDVEASLNRLVQERWLTESDANRIRLEMLSAGN
jgi:hypothetical protein